MFGVVDETGLLQYGQVKRNRYIYYVKLRNLNLFENIFQLQIFVQYHVNMQEKTPRPSASKVILEGTVDYRLNEMDTIPFQVPLS